MHLILVVDDMSIIRDPIAAALTAAGYRTATAADGAQALASARREKPDLILMDLAMPGMNGLIMLRELRREPALAKIPVFLLTSANEKRIIMAAAKLGAVDCMLKSRFSLTELLARVKKALQTAGQRNAAAPAAPIAAPATVAPVRPPPAPAAPLTKEQCLQRAETAIGAKALSGVVAQVIALAASPRGNMSELAGLIGRDPALSARVLNAANSAAYASNRGPVTNIPDAVRHVGCATVRNIATTLGIFEAMPQSSEDGFNPIRCWQHSFAAAVLCERLSTLTKPELASTAYLVGLCHDLGEILFRTHFGTEYRHVQHLAATTKDPLPVIERRMLGMSRGELLRVIVARLGLPEVIRAAIDAFHADDAHLSTDPLVRTLRLADAYADGLGLASSGASLVRLITKAECRSAVGRDDPPTPDAAQLRCDIYALTAMLARLSPAEEAALMAPLHPRRDVRVWVARESGLSPFDPLAAAAVSVADATVYDRLPRSAAELGECAALVVAARTPTASALSAQDIARAASLVPTSPTPVLWICARAETVAPAPGGVQPTQSPVSFDTIARFLTAAATPTRASAAA